MIDIKGQSLKFNYAPVFSTWAWSTQNISSVFYVYKRARSDKLYQKIIWRKPQLRKLRVIKDVKPSGKYNEIFRFGKVQCESFIMESQMTRSVPFYFSLDEGRGNSYRRLERTQTSLPHWLKYDKQNMIEQTSLSEDFLWIQIRTVLYFIQKAVTITPFEKEIVHVIYLKNVLVRLIFLSGWIVWNRSSSNLEILFETRGALSNAEKISMIKKFLQKNPYRKDSYNGLARLRFILSD